MPSIHKLERIAVKRRFTLLPAAVLLAGVLTSCTAESPEDSSAGAEAGAECTPAGAASEAVTVDGDFGGELTLSSEFPIESEAVERSVLSDGDGDEITADDLVRAQLNVFNGQDGTLVVTESATMQTAEGVSPWVHDIMNCATIGERAAVVVPVTEVYPPEAIDSIAGLTGSESLIIVADFIEIAPEPPAPPATLDPSELLEKAEGEEQDTPDGTPEVELDESGAPTITMPDGVEAPEELTIHTLIEGEGEEVEDGDRVYVHYRGVIWRTGEEFDSSWSRGAPIDFMTTGVIGGFRDALVGQKVGSQVISIVPAEDGGYGAATLQQQGHEADDVMVFVLDILGTVHPEN